MKLPFLLLFAGLFSSGIFAQDTASSASGSFSKIKLSGYGYYMFGQIVSGIYGEEWAGPSTTINHLWLSTCLVHLNATSDVTDWFTAKLGFETYVSYFYKGVGAMHKASYFRNYRTYLPTVEGIMHWKFEQPIVSSLKIVSGLFPYTINSQVKTLGNYLFRSTVHPVSIQNKMDYPWADLLGGIAETGLFDNKIIINAMIASEFNNVPLFDFTPAFGLVCKPNDIIDIGGNIAFSHALQASCGLLPDSLGEKWQGTKLDFRAIFDPKPLFGGMNYLAADQFKIYAELAILGLKNRLEVDTTNLAQLRSNDPDTTELKDLVFPKNSLLHRMPFMVGINLPTWKILDLLSIELEWFHSPYANDWLGKFDTENTDARQPVSLNQWDTYINRDNFKWAINIRKSIGNLELRSLIGSDHTIYKIVNDFCGFEQTMKRPKDWHWFVELRYNL